MGELHNKPVAVQVSREEIVQLIKILLDPNPQVV